MLFGKRERTLRNILIVEDEPLVAFDNEHFLSDAGYHVVGTVDRVADAIAALARGGIDLVVADVRLSDGGNGIDVARAASAQGVPVLFASGSCPADAQRLAIGCLAKPYSQRDLGAAIAVVAAKLAGRTPRRVPAGLSLYDESDA